MSSLSKTLYPLFSTGSTQEDRSQLKILDWDVEHQSKLTKHNCTQVISRY